MIYKILHVISAKTLTQRAQQSLRSIKDLVAKAANNFDFAPAYAVA
jgi:hypothetical protein